MSTDYISAVDTAKLLRKHLKARFPGTTFSVRTRKYAGGASIDVRYEDGPPFSEVEPVAKMYAGATFDGMRDLKEYHSRFLAGEDGQPREVHFGADFVFVNRDYSLPVMTETVRKVADRWGVEPPEIHEPTDYRGAEVSSDDPPGWTYGATFRAVVHEDLQDADLTTTTTEA